MRNAEDQIDALIINWPKAITSRDIDALVQLKLLKRRSETTSMTGARNGSGAKPPSCAERTPQ